MAKYLFPMTLKVTYNLNSSSKRQNHYSGFSSTMSSSSMINSYNGMKTKTGINGSINPKTFNEVNGHFGKGNVYENGTENNYKNNEKPHAFSTHEAITTRKQIREPHLNTLYQLSAGIYHPTKVLPMPPFDDMPVPIPGGFCEKSGTTVIFDEDVHLNLGK